MTLWLMKSEPFVFGWHDLVRDGRAKWDGVRNYTARNYLAAMKTGDAFLFYHSNEGKAVVGVGEIIAEAEPDVTVTPDKLTKDGRNPWVVVTVAPKYAFKRAVRLAELREVPELAEMALFKYSRLSVQPVTEAEWNVVTALGGRDRD